MGNYLGLNINKDPLLSADRNGDGIITRTEWNVFVKKFESQQQASEAKISTLQDLLTNKNEKLQEELEKNKTEQKELEFLRNRIRLLENEKGSEIKPIIKKKKEGSKVSRAVIRKYVNEMMKDKDINIKYFPDNVEKAIYENTFFIILNILENISETSEIDFIGHKVSLNWN